MAGALRNTMVWLGFAEDERDRVVADELLADQKRLRQPLGAGLFGVVEHDAET